MEWLKKLLEKNGVPDEITEAIMTESKTENANYIPKSRFDEVNAQVKDLKGQLTERDNQLKDLGAKAKDSETLSKQIAELQEANKQQKEQAEAATRNMAIDYALKNALKDNKAKYEDLLLGKFDRDKLKVKEDGTIEGIDEQLNGIKEGYKDLFEAPLAGRAPTATGGGLPPANPLQAQYDEAVKAGNTVLAISLKNKMYEQPAPQI